ncbi:GPO family capsid scaffolding protein [Burkholderia multivorans]|uniref:GPO family capsid scaffolding protein n=1 Tax=Burkholderia multivorans TaxID=87883 RepID=UPI000D009F2B|nr:GPO family capsid scaffolding protein [Burkholderia multivorans]MBU9297954.1 GPO family capsid scaffolding protein [Burkholderia multivorans]MBU9523273.1 GPO family capsid scaffolding protein [Burkholderia multivorans]PRH10743.1 phage capsid protein [Burkholderia multivorans]
MFKRKLSLIAIAVGSMASLFAIDAHAATTAIAASLQHGDVLGGIGAAGAAAFGIGQVANADAKHATTKWFRVAVEGATTDGRNIEREWILQMAAQYDPALYGARVNCEHIRGYAPMSANQPFGAYGDVTALKAEQITDGPLKGKYALYAQLKPTQALIDLVNAKQKVYTSIEINFSFADTKQAYLVGLAVTDSPASLGTDILTFAASQGANNPFNGRKQHPDNLFSAAEEAVIEFEAAQPAGGGVALFKRVGEILGLVKEKGASDDKRFADVTQAIEALATFSKDQSTRVDELAGRVSTLDAELASEKAAHAETARQLAALNATLSTQPGGMQRPLATGGGAEHKTDC